VGDASSQRAIWLYCSSQEKAIQAKSRIADEIAKSETRKNNDWHSGWDLEITGALGEKLADFNWFLEIFSELGIGGDDR
jgi:hypothetical protein